MIKKKDIAKILKISRPEVTYITKGLRPLSYSQSLRFKELFGGSVEEWKSAPVDNVNEALELLTEEDIREAV